MDLGFFHGKRWPGLLRLRIFERDQQAATAWRQVPPSGLRISGAHVRRQRDQRAAVVDTGAVRKQTRGNGEGVAGDQFPGAAAVVRAGGAGMDPRIESALVEELL